MGVLKSTLAQKMTIICAFSAKIGDLRPNLYVLHVVNSFSSLISWEMFPTVICRHCLASILIFLGLDIQFDAKESQLLPILKPETQLSVSWTSDIPFLVLRWYFNLERSILLTFLSFSHPCLLHAFVLKWRFYPHRSPAH